MSDKKPNRARRDFSAGRPRLLIVVPDSRPSWRRFGDGSAHLEAIACRDAVSFTMSETAFAGIGDKRDVTREVMVDIDRAAIAELHKLLGEFLARPANGEPLEVELAHSGAVAVRIGDYTLGRGEAPGMIAIAHDDGEGGDFPAGEVESAIADYFRKAF